MRLLRRLWKIFRAWIPPETEEEATERQNFQF